MLRFRSIPYLNWGCALNLLKAFITIWICILIAACDSNDGGAEKAGAAIDDTLDKVGNTFDALDRDGPMESAGEVVDEAFAEMKDASVKSFTQLSEDAEEIGSEAFAEAKSSAQLASQQALETAREKAKEYSERIAEESAAAKQRALEAAKKKMSNESDN